MMRPRGLLLLLALGSCLYCAQGKGGEGTFHGQVVDADTRQPIPGAAVVVIWTKKFMYFMDPISHVHEVVEVLTDEEGRFAVEDDPGINWNPLLTVDREPFISILYPGYGPYPDAMETALYVEETGGRRELGWTESNQALRRGTTVQLPRLTSVEQLRKHLGSIGIGGDVASCDIPNTARYVNEQRRMAMLTTFEDVCE